MGSIRRRLWNYLGCTAGTSASMAIALTLVIAIGACRKEAQRPTANREARMKTVVIPVEGMSCSACAARIKKTLASIEGVSEVQVNLAERNARIGFAPGKLSADRVVAAINDLGYRAGAASEIP